MIDVRDMTDSQLVHYIGSMMPDVDAAAGLAREMVSDHVRIVKAKLGGRDQVRVFGSLGWITIDPDACRQGECRTCQTYGHCSV